MTELLGKISQLVSAGLGVDFSQILIQLIAIIILFIVIKVKLWGPVTKLIEDRQNYIKEQVEIAAKTKQEVALEKENYLKQIENAKQEGRDIVAKATTLANSEAEKIVGDAKTQADLELSKAKVMIDQEVQKAKRDIQKETIDIAFELASKIVDKEVSIKDNEEIVNEFLKGVDNNAS